MRNFGKFNFFNLFSNIPETSQNRHKTAQMDESRKRRSERDADSGRDDGEGGALTRDEPAELRREQSRPSKRRREDDGDSGDASEPARQMKEDLREERYQEPEGGAGGEEERRTQEKGKKKARGPSGK